MIKVMATVVDLFCGCGGLSHGFIQAGYQAVLGVDNDSTALRTFQANHNCPTANLDLHSDESIEEIATLVGSTKINVVIGGPPCQGFSLAGPRKLDDPRNRLFMAMFKTVTSLDSDAFLIENVPGMATLYGGKIKDEVVDLFRGNGYDVKAKVVVAADYGVPQIRKRLFIVGVKKEIGHFIFPDPSHSVRTYVTTQDAIGDLPPLDDDMGEEESQYNGAPLTEYQKLMRNGTEELFNHVATAHTQKVKDVISQVPDGGNYKDLPLGVGEHRRFDGAWTRYHSKKPSRTIDTGHRNHFHYKYNRVPTVRENARLQSFPDSFRFFGTRTQQQRHVGNAVPPLIGYTIGKRLLEVLSGEQTSNENNGTQATLQFD
jgi:DNA (cytosine-5)-methyltransferase 1